ncbi:MAG: hypothetical protein J6B77_03605 [Clostridia bacterium]|nr:hypothetical protein [Clostridia bacterium]
MLYPTISELTKGEYNRYELALATAKCARIITGEYVRQREAAERSMTGTKDTDRPLISMIDAEYRDEKAVKTAVSRLSEGEYSIVRLTPEEMAEEEARAAELERRNSIYSEIPDMLPDEEIASADDEDAEDEEDAEEDASEETVEEVDSEAPVSEEDASEEDASEETVSEETASEEVASDETDENA